MNIISPINAYTGYGITGYNIWKNIYKNIEDTTLFLIGSADIEEGWDKNSLVKSIGNQKKFDSRMPCLKIWAPQDMIMRTSGGSKYGGLSFFETNKFSDIEIRGYEALDIIFTATKWSKSILMEHGFKDNDIKVCYQGIDTDTFDGQLLKDKQEDKYVFINIGKWEIRKGHDILLEMFNSAFSKQDNVELWMINHNSFLSQEENNKWVKMYKESALGDKIKIFPRLATQKILANIISLADCGIYPSRAEGWNLEALETMAMNKPIILTNYSAHTEYANKDNSYLIDIKEEDLAIDNIWFHGTGSWAKIDIDQIEQGINHMRYVYNNNIKDNALGLLTAKNYTWDKTANIIIKNMK